MQVAHLLSFCSCWMTRLSYFCFSSIIGSSTLDQSEACSSYYDMLCYESDIVMIIMLSTLFEDEVYLGFAQKQPLQERTYELTFFGGYPIFLYEMENKLLECNACNQQKLTFACQIFCPLQFEQSYNRVLYVFYCEKCYRFFKCLKQQTNKGQKIEKVEPKNIRIISQKSYEIESQSFGVKQLLRIIKKANLQVQQEAIQQAQDEQDEDEQEQQMNQVQEVVNYVQLNKQGFVNKIDKQQLQNLKYVSENMQQQKKQEKDPQFQQYKKIMTEIDGPVLLYSNIPIPYNNQPINPKHFCKYCNSKLSLQLQITEKFLNLNQKLVGMDWGSLMVFTCTQSCNQSIDQCVVIQLEIDAIKDSEVTALRKQQKNKKKKEQKHKSKSKGKQIPQQIKQEKGKEESDGDWD